MRPFDSVALYVIFFRRAPLSFLLLPPHTISAIYAFPHLPLSARVSAHSSIHGRLRVCPAARSCTAVSRAAFIDAGTLQQISPRLISSSSSSSSSRIRATVIHRKPLRKRPQEHGWYCSCFARIARPCLNRPPFTCRTLWRCRATGNPRRQQLQTQGEGSKCKRREGGGGWVGGRGCKQG